MSSSSSSSQPTSKMRIGSDDNKRSVLSTSTTTLDSSNKKTKTIAKLSSSSEFSLLISLPTPLRVYHSYNLGQTQELMDLTLTSKQVCEDCKIPGIEWKIIPTIVIRPHQEGFDSIESGTVIDAKSNSPLTQQCDEKQITMLSSYENK
jgi:hypothetical protein